MALRVLWVSKQGLNSRRVWQQVNEKLRSETISRANIINFLEDMRERGIINGLEETGKGGYHLVYTSAMDESGFKKYIVQTLINCLIRDFPEETRTIIVRIS